MTKDPKARAANIFDVARLAGVSHQTVSRVINGHLSVRPQTREHADHRSYAGTVASGVLRPGDEIAVLRVLNPEHWNNSQPAQWPADEFIQIPTPRAT